MNETDLMELHFNLKDVIYICSLLVGVLGFLFREKIKNAEQEHKISDLNDKYLSMTSSRKALKAECENKLQDMNTIIHKRIDSFKQDLANNKKYMIKTTDELKKLYHELDKKVETGFASVLSELKNIKNE